MAQLAPPDHLPNGIICTSKQYALSVQDQSTIHCLTRGESIGLAVISEAGLISLIAVLYVFVTIGRNIVWRVKHDKRWGVIHRPMDLLILCLFLADALQAIGAVMDIKWIQDGKVEVGSFCSAQGGIQQVGETGVAMFTLTITIYTFLGLWLGKAMNSMNITRSIVGCIWLFLILMVVLGNVIHHGNNRFESPTPYWCWINQNYLQLRIWGEYFWFWLTLVFSFVAYTLLFLWGRGNIVRHEESWWKFRFKGTDVDTESTLRRFRRRSIVMLAYPFVFSILILPVSVVRWIGFAQEGHGGTNRVSSVSTIGVVALYGLSGLLNVILFVTTRPHSGLFSRQRDDGIIGQAQAPSTRHDTIVEQGDSRGILPRGTVADSAIELGRLPSARSQSPN